MNEQICCITNKEETAKNEWENDDSDFLWALYSVYKKIKTILFRYLLLTCLNKDISVLLEVINTLKSSQVKHNEAGLNFFKNTMYMCIIPLINILEKIQITHHSMPNGYYIYILPYMC